jgi:riboflavin biosynthesis pyrimidine reductase
MRQIIPVQASGQAGGSPGGRAEDRPAGEPFGPADPLKLAGRISPSAAGEPGVRELIDRLAQIYAYPDGRWVRANFVTSVDGAVTAEGRSGGLSGAADRLVFGVLRSLADVVLVGAGTARAERYRQAQPAEIWQQLRDGRPAAPPIAVVTRRLNLDLDGRLLGGHQGGGNSGRDSPGGADRGQLASPIVLTTRQAPEALRAAAAETARILVVGDDDVSAPAAIDALTGLGHRRILVEGGPMLFSQLLAAGLANELCVTISPVIEGGHGRRMTTAPDPLDLTGLTLASVLEDDGFLLTRYVVGPG